MSVRERERETERSKKEPTHQTEGARETCISYIYEEASAVEAIEPEKTGRKLKLAGSRIFLAYYHGNASSIPM